jgi:quinone-reactive Ni/Fe-hydrogenase small subunit
MRVVIVGGGIVAAYSAKLLAEYSDVEVVVVSKESHAPYDRIHLCALVDGSKSISDITLELPQNITLELSQEVTSIDKEAKRVFTPTSSFSYDKLIIATGSKPKELFDISHIINASTFRSAGDSFKIANSIKDKNVVLMGVGPIGLELLETLSKINTAKNIYLISRGEHLYSKDMNPSLISIMKKSYEVNDRVRVLFNESIKDHTLKGDTITSIELHNQTIDDPYLIFGVGIAPNVDFARESIDCDKGVIVNEYCQSSDSDIYAIGESAQMDGDYIAGRVKECTLQADAAIPHLMDEPKEEYTKVVAIDGLKVGSFMLADVTHPNYRSHYKDNEELLLSSREENRYDQYILNKDRLERLIGINSNIDLLALKTIMEKEQRVDAQFFYDNRLLSERGKLICSCAGGYEQDLVDIIKENACESFGDMKPFSESGRVCGRCKEDVVNLIAKTPIDPEEAARIKAEKKAKTEQEERERVEKRINKYNQLHPANPIDTTDLDEAIKMFELSKDYNKWVSQITASLRLHPEYESTVQKGLNQLNKIPIIWLELSDCTGNSEAFIKSANPTVDDLILKYVSLDYHELLMAPSGDQSETQLEQIIEQDRGNYILLVEGAVPMAIDGKYLRIGPKGETGIDLLRKAAQDALVVMSVGSCALDGGVVAAAPNPTGAVGVSEALGRDDVINLPGCPVNPINVVGTLLHFLMFDELPELDDRNRPLWAYSTRVHDNCERRGHYDLDEFVLEWGDEGAKKGWCLFKMGCKGPYADINCPSVKFNEGTSWPVQVGHGCFGCGEGVIAFDKYANNRPLEVEE